MKIIRIQSLLAGLFLSFGSLVNALDLQDHTLPINKLAQRRLVVSFLTSTEEKPFMLVRADMEDLAGFATKNNRKTLQERAKFKNQFNMDSTNKILKTYQNAVKWKAETYTTYLFGLFSIYSLENTTAHFCGEAYLDDQSLNHGGFIEISTDIDPTKKIRELEAPLNKLF